MTSLSNDPISLIMDSPELQAEPTVLLDIGASGGTHAKWKDLARYSICIAFDADERQSDALPNEAAGYREFHLYDSVVAPNASESVDFYLTRYPSCSSTLRPLSEELSQWTFVERFAIESKVRVKAIDLQSVIGELGLNRVDWIKIDSQGTDLRLFQSLGGSIIPRVLVAELEPGILDAYEGEDKLHHVLAYMDAHDFWVSSMDVRGAQRADKRLLNGGISYQSRRWLHDATRESPGWAEVMFMNAYSDLEEFTKRDLMLGWLLAYLQGQYGFAYGLALRAGKLLGDKMLTELLRCTETEARRRSSRTKLLQVRRRALRGVRKAVRRS